MQERADSRATELGQMVTDQAQASERTLGELTAVEQRISEVSSQLEQGAAKERELEELGEAHGRALEERRSAMVAESSAPVPNRS